MECKSSMLNNENRENMIKLIQNSNLEYNYFHILYQIHKKIHQITSN